MPSEPQTTAMIAAGEGPPPTSRRRWTGLGFRALILTLLGVNLWWARDLVPSADLKAVGGWIDAGKYGRAERALRARLRRSPHDGEAHMLLARVLAARNEMLGCARQLHQVPFWWPSKPQALILEGQAYKTLDRARDAEAAWQACTADDPLHPIPPQYFSAAAHDLIALYMLEERFSEAIAVIWRAYNTAAPADIPAVLLMRVRAELERIAQDEARATLHRYARAAPDDWEARRALARAEMGLGNLAAAHQEIRRCLEARPNDLHVWRDWLEIHHAQGDREGIVAALKRLPPAADRDAGVWKFRGMAREWAGDWAGAAAAYRQALRLDPDEGEYHYKLALALDRLGRHDEAADHRRRNAELRQARHELRDAYIQYSDLARRPDAPEGTRARATARMADACEKLGWTREADAWRKLLPPGSRDEP